MDHDVADQPTPPHSALVPVVLDLSHHNDVHDWQALKDAGIKGVILKCTQGTKYPDPTYATRKAAARAAGLLVGAYHFATNAEPRAQVDWFLAHAQVDNELLVALDWENNPDGPDMDVAEARLFIEYLMLKVKRPKSQIVVYGGNVLKERVTSADDINFFGDCKLWLCEYGPHAMLPPAWHRYWLWQFSEKFAGLRGVTGKVDANVFGGTDLAAEWAPGPGDTSEPVSTRVDIVADDNPSPVKAASMFGGWSDWSFARINDLADQGSRLAGKIRDLKNVFWKGAGTVGGTAATAAAFVDPTQGTGLALSKMASAHPFLLLLLGMSLTGVIFYVGVRLIERYALTAHADGRYVPRGGK